MLNFKELEANIGKLAGTMKFFPSDPDARIGIIEAIGEMASGMDQVRYLVKWLPKRYREWPGMHEVRALFCKKYKPRDGIEAYSTVYPDGIPSDDEPLALPSGAPQLAAGEPASADPQLAMVVFNLVQHNTLQIIASTPEEVELRDGETDLSGLLRQISKYRAARENRGPRAASDEELATIKRIQLENAQHEATRKMLQPVEEMVETSPR